MDDLGKPGAVSIHTDLVDLYHRATASHFVHHQLPRGRFADKLPEEERVQRAHYDNGLVLLHKDGRYRVEKNCHSNHFPKGMTRRQAILYCLSHGQRMRELDIGRLTKNEYAKWAAKPNVVGKATRW